MRIFLEQNGGDDSDIIPYFAHIEISTITVDFNTAYRVPIFQKDNVYGVEICGFVVEAGSPNAVISLAERVIANLINRGRLPTYVFIARRSHKMYPVYTRDHEVFVASPGRTPFFKHVELAKVREYLTDYMHQIGQLGLPGKSEKLHVRGVHRYTLGLVRPIFYLKKRPQFKDDNEFWAPVFPSKTGESIYTYAASGRREVDIDDGREILRLRSQVAQALIADKRLKEDYDLRADRLLPEYWKKVEPHLGVLLSKLTFKDKSFDIYKEGKYLIAVEYRENEDRYSFYIGQGADDLRERAAKDLVRRSLVNDPAEVKIVEAG